MNSLISIIIPTFNRGYLIKETLDSIINQNYKNWECIVVDDGSEDNTKEIISTYLKKDIRIKYLTRPNNIIKGVSSCRNYGLKYAKGEYINFIDSDDIIDIDHLNFHAEILENKDIMFSVSNSKIFTNNIDNIESNWSIINSSNFLDDMIDNKVLWAIGSVVWRKSCIRENPFNEKLINSEEWLFHLNQILNFHRYVINTTTTYFVRNHNVRAGKITSIQKVYSIFFARTLLFEKMYSMKNINNNIEKSLLNSVFFALRLSIEFKYYKIFFLIFKWLMLNFIKFKSRLRILKIFLISVPIYFLTSKGEKLFK